MIKNQYREIVVNALAEEDLFMDILSPREIKILIMRYGNGPGKEKTLVEVGKKFGITRERIRQIEKKCIEKIIQYEKDKILADKR